ncbi:class I SAM-dependent methyltransferase [Desulfomonile tiedjei]|uniref:Methylase involved in ubiquinone/menaquinone biosynthesis n=1 Tax=Desulfomonile tiedjei (strain ATCC 49306 / DSM 6799 / DCB-1) TaxID=706587 RepID=I4CDW5_DESTA|nr:class I SAM-dependent methyltransferase [Desulfomonile tiedjei]AFM27756.1 methylase involved in ubiquinone/menaquinone biosynthesis [Desulfomonile tiedjei DSM 6799]
MHSSKTKFFNSQVEEEWAAVDYSDEKIVRIDRMLRLAQVRMGMKILEPGCGTGRLTRILADRVGTGGHIVAIDISEKMVEACLRKANWKAHVEVVCASVEEYPLPPREFDAVICHQVFPHFNDKLTALNVFSTILKPYGRLAIFHFINSAQINDLHRIAHEAVMEDLMPAEDAMTSMLDSVGFQIDIFEDDENGYLLISHLVH